MSTPFTSRRSSIRLLLALGMVAVISAGVIIVSAKTIGGADAQETSVASGLTLDVLRVAAVSASASARDEALANHLARHEAEQQATRDYLISVYEQEQWVAEVARQQQAAQVAATPPVEPSAPAESQAVGSPGIAPDSYWDRMATCETGGNWAHYPYGTWTGGLGIYNQTWTGWGGGEFAATAGQATRDQQIIVANRIATLGYGNLGPVGYSAWGCVAAVGYP